MPGGIIDPSEAVPVMSPPYRGGDGGLAQLVTCPGVPPGKQRAQVSQTRPTSQVSRGVGGPG